MSAAWQPTRSRMYARAATVCPPGSVKGYTPPGGTSPQGKGEMGRRRNEGRVHFSCAHSSPRPRAYKGRGHTGESERFRSATLCSIGGRFGETRRLREMLIDVSRMLWASFRDVGRLRHAIRSERQHFYRPVNPIDSQQDQGACSCCLFQN